MPWARFRCPVAVFEQTSADAVLGEWLGVAGQVRLAPTSIARTPGGRWNAEHHGGPGVVRGAIKGPSDQKSFARCAPRAFASGMGTALPICRAIATFEPTHL